MFTLRNMNASVNDNSFFAYCYLGIIVKGHLQVSLSQIIDKFYRSIGRRFQSADLLLGRAHLFVKLLLRKAGFFSQGGQFQRDISCFPGFFEAFGKNHILELFLEVLIEIRFSFHCGCLTNPSSFRMTDWYSAVGMRLRLASS